MNFVGEQQEEEDEEVTTTSKLISFSPPFSPSSSSSSSSAKYKNFLPHHQQQHQSLWLGSSEHFQQTDQRINRQPQLNSDSNLDLMDLSLGNNNEPDNSGANASGSSIEKEHMFDKVVTPSDVGKLNRLVIPKQHAEKYFPLDSSSNEKGLLLNFEDRTGKAWRFRYSYWNSSQSYVMTKGWSRFVKEKKLDAGDIVSFQRGVGEAGRSRLFIDWRRRPNTAPDPGSFTHLELPNSLHFPSSMRWGRLLPAPRYYEQHHQLQYLNSSSVPRPYHHHHHHHLHHNYQYHYNHQQQVASYGNAAVAAAAATQYYLRPAGAVQIGGVVNQQGGDQSHHHVPMVIDSVPVVHGKTVGKRLRLFGVNMECPIQDDSSSSSTIDSTMSSFSPHLASSSLPSPQLRASSSAQMAARMPAELISKKGKGSSSLSFDLDI